MKHLFSRLMGSLLLLPSLLLTLPGIAQTTRWAKALNPHNTSYGWPYTGNPVVDQAGNTYLPTASRLAIPGDTVPTQPDPYSRNFQLIKYDSLGTMRWTRLIRGAHITEYPVLAVEPTGAGALYVGLTCEDSLGAGTVQIALDSASLGGVLLKWSPAGTLQWYVRSTGTGVKMEIQAITTDAAGNVYAAGRYQGAPTIGTIALPATPFSTANYRLFVVKVNGTGVVQWAQASEVGAIRIGGIRASASGTAVYVGLNSYRGFAWGSLNTSAATGPNQQAVSLQLDASTGQGQQLRAIGLVGANITRPASLESCSSYPPKVDEVGDLYVVGQVNALYGSPQLINLGPFSLTPTITWPGTGQLFSADNYVDAYVAKLSFSSGALQWLHHFTGFGTDASARLEASALTGSELVATGHFGSANQGGGVKVDGVPLIAQNIAYWAPLQPYAVAINRQTGVVKWGRAFGVKHTTGFEMIGGKSVGANDHGDVAIVGESFEGDSLSLPGLSDWLPLNQLPPMSSMTPNGFLARLGTHSNTVTGQSFLDANANGARDAGEGPHPTGSVVAVSPGAWYTMPDAQGLYRAEVGIGTYSVSLPNPPLYYTVATSGSASATFNSYGNVATGPTFAL